MKRALNLFTIGTCAAAWLNFLLCSLLVSELCSAADHFTYVKTKTVEQVDDYHGVKVPDPYRWLEDDRSAETAQWVEAENKITFGYLEKIPFREQVRRRLSQLLNYAKYSAPERRGEHFFFLKNDGLQNQSVLYIQQGLDGKPELLLDPNQFSKDGSARLGAMAISKDGKYLAYGKSMGGSDWLEGHVMEIATRKVLPDELKWIKVSGFSWAGSGFYYSRYPAPERGHELSSKNEFHTVYFHRVGTPQSDDTIVYEDKAHPQRFHGVQVTEDERYAVLYVMDETSRS